jgi:hypothetical protein
LTKGLVIGALLTCAVRADAHTPIMCDVNHTGYVTTSDARRVLQFVAGLREFTAEEQLLADATGNGQVTAYDAMCILQKAAGKIVPGNHCGEAWPHTH